MLHPEREELHGITVVVEGHAGGFWVGRFHETIPRGIVLLDVGRHDPAPGAPSPEAWIDRIRRFGLRVEEHRVVIPTQDVQAITRLSDWRVRA